jgi:hypothetical protein
VRFEEEVARDGGHWVDAMGGTGSCASASSNRQSQGCTTYTSLAASSVINSQRFVRNQVLIAGASPACPRYPRQIHAMGSSNTFKGTPVVWATSALATMNSQSRTRSSGSTGSTVSLQEGRRGSIRKLHMPVHARKPCPNAP